MAISVYRGPFSEEEATRLLWRAGFGPKPGEAARLAQKGLGGAVKSLLDPPRARLRGPRPKDEHGNPIAPNDLWSHDALWWLDKMVRSNQPLVERMALNWHDWFATGEVSSQKRSIKQAKLFRRDGLGSFKRLLQKVTIDEAMLVWLSGIENSKWSPNENYARELMELFTLGVSDGSGYPYSEDDVREQARALTGWRATWRESTGLTNFRFDSGYHDGGSKTIFGESGAFDWKDSCRLCLEHPAHAGFFVDKLWSYFIAGPIPEADRAALIRKYKRRHQVKPVLKSILKHPLLYEGPAMVKPPVVFIVGMLRARGRGIDRASWGWVSDLAGQRLFRPPNVAGWNEERWLDTSTFRGRWIAVQHMVQGHEVGEANYPEDETPAEALNKALRWWDDPYISSATRAKLIQFGEAVEAAAVQPWHGSTYRALRQNALRVLIAVSPDLQTC